MKAGRSNLLERADPLWGSKAQLLRATSLAIVRCTETQELTERLLESLAAVEEIAAVALFLPDGRKDPQVQGRGDGWEV